jgi:formate--tetrahydrofolate ligase
MSTSIRPITEVASDLGVAPGDLIPYGADKAKIRPVSGSGEGAQGNLILVSAITPTSAGEGKTTTSIGLAQGLAREGQKVCLALREPSLGPTFGMKGGATGGGRAILVPTEDINLHFTGDFHAVTSAHNLLAAMLDNHIHQGNKLHIDPRRVFFRRVMDVNDRSLRNMVIGLGGVLEGVPRETGFDITAASEVMAMLCLAEDAEDMRVRLSRTIVAQDLDQKSVTAGDLKAVGAMMALLKDALMPNLVQTVDGVPAIVHGGPFANIAHGCNSVIATKTALRHADWVVTEAGFGFALGAEKFFDIKCVSAGLKPAAVVLVATVRALKRHGGVKRANLTKPNTDAVEQGLGNLFKHIEGINAFKITPIVALNRFAEDSDEEIDVVRRACDTVGVSFAVSDHFARGGEGAVELAKTVVQQAIREDKNFTPLYDWSEPIRDKLLKIAQKMYGAKDVEYDSEARRDIKRIERLGFAGLPVCMAKTPTSLTDNPRLAGRPEDFTITVRRVLLSAGAGFIVPVLGSIMRMPGLPAEPQAESIDLVNGKVTGLLGA